jgi:hypothetical protein
MSYGIMIAALILVYCSNRFPLFAIIGMLISAAFIAGILYLIWSVAYPNDMWFFWIPCGLAAGYVLLVNGLSKIVFGK